jgi:hypothetical protein
MLPFLCTVAEIGTEDWTGMLDNDAFRLLWRPCSRLLDVRFLEVGQNQKRILQSDYCGTYTSLPLDNNS